MANRRSGPWNARLSRSTIVDGAIALADAEGLDAATIQQLAKDHEVAAIALFWRFKDKDCWTASASASLPAFGFRRRP